MSLFPGWTAADIPDLTGRRAVVTGASSGLGLETARVLAAHGAEVVMTSRDPVRGEQAVRRVLAQVPGASVEHAPLDLADLDSVRGFADRVGEPPLDLLVNNAGVMAVPPRHTADGFELQMGTNHLGHFALTGLLLPALLARPGARVVTVSSFLHWFGSLDFADLMSERSYDPWRAYSGSKLANLLFVRELTRRAREVGVDLVSVGAHPGYARTNLVAAGPATGRRQTGAVLRLGTALVGQSVRTGALPQLRAATDPGVRGGEYLGPRGPAEQRGLPTRVRCSANARDDRAAALLWAESERLTGVTFGALDAAGAPTT
jgi:NAD(P)-dependent dehydrogenase (short-subunit alcohol dehydrogenase family)